MKRAVYFIILLSLLLNQEGRSQSIPADLGKVMWLLGTWVNDSKQDPIYESWSVKNEHELQGLSYLVQGQDTVVKETIRLVAEHDDVYYIPTVKDQNKGKPIRFALSSLTDTEMVFENPEHDFPQLISYKKDGEHGLLAEIWAAKEGEIQKIRFSMKRVSF